jgi:tRNA threonylcarbamoyladenosine modification (KEOPS) complex Cgi121 subunit
VRSAAIKGSRWAVAIGGFRSVDVVDAKGLIRRVSEAAAPGEAQLLDADRVAGWEHLRMAAVNAAKRTENRTASSRSLAVETLLTASCQDQITRGIEMLGLTRQTRNLALVVIAEERLGAEEAYDRASGELKYGDDSVLDVTPEKLKAIREFFGVTGPELESVGGDPSAALTGILVERGALLGLGS